MIPHTPALGRLSGLEDEREARYVAPPARRAPSSGQGALVRPTTAAIAVLLAMGAMGCSTTSPDLAGALQSYESFAVRQHSSPPAGEPLGADDSIKADAPASAPAAASEGGYIDWKKRYGPAYRGDFWRSVGRDSKEFAAITWDNAKATLREPWSVAGIAAAVVAGVSIDAAGLNGTTADHYERHGSGLNTFWDSVGDAGGNPGTHFAIAGAAYLAALATDHVETYEKSKTMLHALALNGAVTLALKGLCNTESPNGDDFGWPSGHASSSFCFATVLAEEYGPMAGVPAFAFATFVAYERVDARNHDLADVASGALLGMAIGHAVSRNHANRIAGFELSPYIDERGQFGISASRRW
jgi:hypothetical protein